MVAFRVDLQQEGADGVRRVTLNEKWQKFMLENEI